MPIFLFFVATLLIAAGLNNKTEELKSLLAEDFTPSDGRPGFATWIVALFVIGAVGYYKPLKPFSTAFLVLIILVMFLTNGNPASPNGGFFARFTQLLKGNT
jgi:hypothetical protein